MQTGDSSKNLLVISKFFQQIADNLDPVKKMYNKLKHIYLIHFKLIIIWNIFLSLLITSFFFEKGFDRYPLYIFALMGKGGGYLISVVFEKLFFFKHSYYYRNLGFSYRKLFGILVAADWILFMLLMTLCALIFNQPEI